MAKPLLIQPGSIALVATLAASAAATPTFQLGKNTGGTAQVTVINALATNAVKIQVSADGVTFYPLTDTETGTAISIAHGTAGTFRATPALYYNLLPAGSDTGPLYVGC